MDGVDISTSYRGWHDKIGYIPQTIYMLDDTIRNNIAFGKKEGINDEDVWAALRQAQLDEFVESLEEGLDTVIGEAQAGGAGARRGDVCTGYGDRGGGYAGDRQSAG